AITNANQDYAKILKVLKLYDLIRQSIYNQSTSEILHLIGNIIDCNMQVIDIKNGEQLYDITGQKSSTEKLSSKQQFIQIPVPVSRPMSLLINSRSQKVLDELIINHVATIVGLAVERDTANYEKQRRLGSETLSDLIEEQYGEESSALLLAQHDLHNKELYLISCSLEREELDSSWLHIRLYEQNIPNILTYKDGILFILIPAD